MAQDESPQTHTDGEDRRKADLEALFSAWDQRDGAPEGPPEPGADEAQARLLRYGVRLRLVVSIILISVTAYVMWSTRQRFAYWLSSDTPVALGDLRERWLAGERTLTATSNTYVALDGLTITRPFIVRPAGDDAVALAADADHLFFDPLFGVVVRTRRELPAPNWHKMGMMEIDGGFMDAIQRKLVFPSDLTVSFGGVGRLVRGDDVPEHMRRAVNTYARDAKREAEQLWVFLDEDAPSEHSLAGIVWALAAIVPLVSLFFLMRAMRLRARFRAERPPAP